jgi:hypothetical protein
MCHRNFQEKKDDLGRKQNMRVRVEGYRAGVRQAQRERQSGAAGGPSDGALRGRQDENNTAARWVQREGFSEYPKRDGRVETRQHRVARFEKGAQEVKNTLCFPLYEKFDIVVLKGARNISGPLENVPPKFLV